MSFNGRLHCESMLCAEQHFRIASNYDVEIRFRRKVMPAVVRVVLRNKKLRTASLLFPRLWYQPPSGRRVLPLPKVQEPAATRLAEPRAAARTAGATRHGATAPVNIHAWFSWRPVCLLKVGMPPSPAPLHTVGSGQGPFFVNGRLSTLTFQRHLRAAAIFYPLSWPCRLFRGWILLLCGWSWCKGQVSRGRCGSVGNTIGNVNNEA